MAGEPFRPSSRRTAVRGEAEDGPLGGPVVTWHDAAHELVEQGNGEGRITVMGTPDHSLGDQLVPRWPQRGHFTPQLPSDVS